MTYPDDRARDASGSRRSSRARDATGRPRNSRPRDAYGRPLPHGAEGVEGVPEDLDLGPADALTEAQRLLDAGRPFHAHEVLEAAWKAAPDGERTLWQGLAQLAVGLTHIQRENAKGAVALLARGSERVRSYAGSPPHGIRAAELVTHAEDLAARIERDGLAALGGDDLRPALAAPA